MNEFICDSAECLGYERKARLKKEESGMFRVRDKGTIEEESTSRNDKPISIRKSVFKYQLLRRD